MKYSEVPWVGEIPESWIPMKIKHLIEPGDNGLRIGPYGSALKGKTLGEGPVKIYNQANLIAGDFDLCRHFVSNETYEELKNYTIMPGDICFSMMGTIGKCMIMPENKPLGIMDSHLLKARLNNIILPEFFLYAFDKDNNASTLEQLIFKSQGSIMNGLNSSVVKNTVLAVPPIEEQRSIVSYLEKKCATIDEAIARHKQIIKKLEEYRTVLIEHVVKNGVENISPTTMRHIKLKYVGRMKSGDNITSEQISDVGMYEVYGGNGSRGFYSDYNLDGEYVLIGRQGALAGNVHIVNGRIWATDHALVFHNSGLIPNRLLYYILLSLNLNQYAFETAAQPGLAASKISNLSICYPENRLEQDSIVSFLDDKTSSIDTAIEKNKTMIDKLEEYRKSIIYNAVTGKIDCREVV